ncbi:Uncharacterised protein [uncultured archaeon]|nr:Uncharacterised protein [uncultured archaeon]
MKKTNLFITSILLIALFTIPVFGFPGMGRNTSGTTTGNITQTGQIIDLANATQSDQNIEISSHLIEVDPNLYGLQNKLFVRETILFRNKGTKIFSGALKTWVPEGPGDLKVMKAQMVAQTGGQPVLPVLNGNIISWQDYIDVNSVVMYVLEYNISVQPTGSITKSEFYSKKLLSPTLINYKYVPSPGYPAFLLKVSKSSDSSITLTDENQNKITSQDFTDQSDSILYRFSDVRFKEINIEISKSPVDLSKIAIYLIIGILIILVLAYPVIRKKSPKLMEIEEKIRNSLKKEPGSREKKKSDKEVASEDSEADELEEESASEAENISGRANDELETEKNELGSKLDKLEKDYASGNLIDEEYEELRNSYRQKLKNINKR